MGVSCNSYLGPFLEVRKPRTIKRVDRCEGHPEYSGKFCPECGTRQEKRFYEVNERPKYPDDDSFYDRLNKSVDNCSRSPLDTDDEFIDGLIPNLSRGDWFMRNPHDGEGCYLNSDIIEMETAKFRSEFSKDIATIIGIFGSRNVSVQYGFLSWYS